MSYILSSGAEAIVEKDGKYVYKKRFKKSFRIPEIDNSLRKSRTKREAKVISKLTGIIPVPEVVSVDTGNKKNTDVMTIQMGHIEGPKLRDFLTLENYFDYCLKLGNYIGKMHSEGIIHGDLTTSNFIVESSSNEIFFIDFGLSYFSEKVEDMAVDLHLLRQALESKHYDVWEKAFAAVLNGYKESYSNFKDVIKRFETVEGRGRNKGK